MDDLATKLFDNSLPNSIWREAAIEIERQAKEIERLSIENAKLNNYMLRVQAAVNSFEALKAKP